MIGKAIKEIRRNNFKIRQVDLANEVGLTKKTIGEIERGGSFSSVSISKILNFLNIKKILFLTEKDIQKEKDWSKICLKALKSNPNNFKTVLPKEELSYDEWTKYILETNSKE